MSPTAVAIASLAASAARTSRADHAATRAVSLPVDAMPSTRTSRAARAAARLARSESGTLETPSQTTSTAASPARPSAIASSFLSCRMPRSHTPPRVADGASDQWSRSVAAGVPQSWQYPSSAIGPPQARHVRAAGSAGGAGDRDRCGRAAQPHCSQNLDPSWATVPHDPQTRLTTWSTAGPRGRGPRARCASSWSSVSDASWRSAPSRASRSSGSCAGTPSRLTSRHRARWSRRRRAPTRARRP